MSFTKFADGLRDHNIHVLFGDGLPISIKPSLNSRVMKANPNLFLRFASSMHTLVDDLHNLGIWSTIQKYLADAIVTKTVILAVHFCAGAYVRGSGGQFNATMNMCFGAAYPGQVLARSTTLVTKLGIIQIARDCTLEEAKHIWDNNSVALSMASSNRVKVCFADKRWSI